MNAQNKEIQSMAAKKDELIGLNRDRELEIKQLDHKLSKARSDAKDAQERVSCGRGGRTTCMDGQTALGVNWRSWVVG